MWRSKSEAGGSFSLEMGQQLADRMLASVGQIDLRRTSLRETAGRGLGPDDRRAGEMHESPCIDERATSVVQIRASARRLHPKERRWR